LTTTPAQDVTEIEEVMVMIEEAVVMIKEAVVMIEDWGNLLMQTTWIRTAREFFEDCLSTSRRRSWMRTGKSLQ